MAKWLSQSFGQKRNSSLVYSPFDGRGALCLSLVLWHLAAFLCFSRNNFLEKAWGLIFKF